PDVPDAILVEHLRSDVLLQLPRQRGGDIVDGDGASTPHIARLPHGLVAFEHGGEGFGNVENVDEVALLLAVLEHHWRLVVEQTRDEDRGNAGIGIAERLARAIGIEESQGDGRYAQRPAG